MHSNVLILNQEYEYEIYKSEKILREFSIANSNISSSKIDKSKFNFFMAIINETEFLCDSGYEFYVSLSKMKFISLILLRKLKSWSKSYPIN